MERIKYMHDNMPEYAIRFGEGVDMGLEKQRAFPFIYTMVPREEDNWERDKARNNLAGFGPAIPPLTTILHPVKLQQDLPFLLLWMKFSVLYDSMGTYLWYEPHAGWFQEQFDYNAAIGTPLTDSIDLSVSFQGPDGRYLYGGQSLMFTDANVVNWKIPVPLDNLQGYDFGCGQLRTPYFLPTDALIMFEITNRHTIKTLVLGAAIYGLKVRIQ
jgi:hypothetical protein